MCTILCRHSRRSLLQMFQLQMSQLFQDLSKPLEISTATQSTSWLHTERGHTDHNARSTHDPVSNPHEVICPVPHSHVANRHLDEVFSRLPKTTPQFVKLTLIVSIAVAVRDCTLCTSSPQLEMGSGLDGVWARTTSHV